MSSAKRKLVRRKNGPVVLRETGINVIFVKICRSNIFVQIVPPGTSYKDVKKEFFEKERSVYQCTTEEITVPFVNHSYKYR